MVEKLRFLDLPQRRLFCLGRIRYQIFVYSVPSMKYVSSVWAIYLKKLLLQLGMKFDTIRSESAIIHAFPFNSEKKRGGVAVLRVIS